MISRDGCTTSGFSQTCKICFHAPMGWRVLGCQGACGATNVASRQSQRTDDRPFETGARARSLIGVAALSVNVGEKFCFFLLVPLLLRAWLIRISLESAPVLGLELQKRGQASGRSRAFRACLMWVAVMTALEPGLPPLLRVPSDTTPGLASHPAAEELKAGLASLLPPKLLRRPSVPNPSRNLRARPDDHSPDCGGVSCGAAVERGAARGSGRAAAGHRQVRISVCRRQDRSFAARLTDRRTALCRIQFRKSCCTPTLSS